jgi:drug/metabolite transporter (DMT)-like permease
VTSAGQLCNVALFVLVNAMWAAMYFANKWVDLGPVGISVWTFLIAIPVLVPFLLWERSRSTRHKEFVQSVGREKRSPWCASNGAGFAVVGILGLLPAALFMAWGEKYTTATSAAMLGLSVPVITPLVAFMVLGERMCRVGWISLSIALTGALILSCSGTSEESAGTVIKSGWLWILLGNAMVLLSNTCSCLYNVFSKELLRRFSPLEVLSYSYVLALALGLILAVWLEPVCLGPLVWRDAHRWWGLVILGVVVYGLAMVLWMYLLTRIDVGLASISLYLLPFFGVVLSALILGEAMTWPMVAGGVITFAGAVLGVVAGNGQRHRDEPT